MKKWMEDWKTSPVKKAFPILSFPAIQLMGISVKDLISDSAVQAKGMKLVAERTDSLASVSLMDLSLEAECFGATIRVSDDEVPTVIGSVVSTEEEADALEIPPIGSGRTGIYIDAMTQAVHTVLQKATTFLINYCNAYKECGANGVVIAEPLAGVLSPTMEEEFSEPYVRQIVEAVQDDSFIVIYHNCGNTATAMTDSLASIGAMGYHFGNAINMEEALEKMPKDKLVMGNVDPAGQFRNGTTESIRKETLELMEKCCKYDNFIISSGCDIPPMSKWENIDAFFAAVSDFYEKKDK